MFKLYKVLFILSLITLICLSNYLFLFASDSLQVSPKSKSAQRSITTVDIINFIIGCIALVIAGITAWWQFFRKPKLKIIFKEKPPYHISETDKKFAWQELLRIKIQNSRRVLARNCFGKIIEWYENNNKVDDFLPLKLKWSSTPSNDFSNINLAFQEFDYLNIAKAYLDYKVITPKTELDKIDSLSKITSKSNSIFELESNHIFKISVYCENEVSKFKWFKIIYTGDSTSELDEKNFGIVKMIELSTKEVKKLLNNFGV